MGRRNSRETTIINAHASFSRKFNSPLSKMYPQFRAESFKVFLIQTFRNWFCCFYRFQMIKTLKLERKYFWWNFLLNSVISFCFVARDTNWRKRALTNGRPAVETNTGWRPPYHFVPFPPKIICFVVARPPSLPHTQRRKQSQKLLLFPDFFFFSSFTPKTGVLSALFPSKGRRQVGRRKGIKLFWGQRARRILV